jgi:hypothetical protein
LADVQLSITTTVYAALHSRARLPIRRLFRRLETQLHNIADDLGDDEARHVTKTSQLDCSTKAPGSTRRILEPRVKPVMYMRAIKEEELEMDYLVRGPRSRMAMMKSTQRYPSRSSRMEDLPRSRRAVSVP